MRDVKKGDYFVVLMVVAAILLVLIYEIGMPNPNAATPAAFSVNNRTYKITAYAYTQAQQEKGLMNETVTNSTFMLFYFGQPGIYSFWMKDTYSQLDIIWLNYSSSTGMAKAVYIVNATPCTSYNSNQDSCIIYTPTVYADYVLETKAGFVGQNNITIGSSIRFLR